MAELDAMLRMLYGSTDADPEVLKVLAVNGSEDEDALTFDEFLQVGLLLWFLLLLLLLLLLFFRLSRSAFFVFDLLAVWDSFVLLSV